MEDISLHLLDVAENALAAGADRVAIRILEQLKENVMIIEIEDNGCGMDEQTAKQALDPFYTSKTEKRVGLGLPMFAQAAREAGGDLEIQSAPGASTVIRARFQLSHPDLKPLGDMAETLATLAAGHPQVQFVFEHRQDDTVVCRWDSEIAKTTGND
ncbi:MAG: ATP-binding protein [Planctomycetota bacterium]|jgi:signal transduction histidine kinase